MCVCVCRASEQGEKFAAQWSRRVRKHGGVTPIPPFMLSEPSVRRLKEMRSNDTLFVSAKHDQRSGSEAAARSKRMSYERGGEEEQ